MNKPHSVPVELLDIDSLAGLREELRLQAHLFKADLKDRWQEAEARWEDIQQELRAVRDVAGRSRDELGAAATLAAEALRKTYQDLRAALRAH